MWWRCSGWRSFAIRRLIDVQPEETKAAFREALADALRGVLVQFLFPRAEGRGRVAAYGVVIPDGEMGSAIAEGRDPFDRTTPLPAGCQTSDEHVRHLVDDGLISKKSARNAFGQSE